MAITKTSKSRKSSTADASSSTKNQSNNNVIDQVVHYSCNDCSTEFSANEDSIACFQCERWFHIKCAQLSTSQFSTIIALKDSVEWFCSKCRNSKNSLSGKPDSDSSVLSERITKLEVAVQNVCTGFSDWKTKAENIEKKETGNKTYADIVRDNLKTQAANRAKGTSDNSAIISSNNTNNDDREKRFVLFLKGADDRESCKNSQIFFVTFLVPVPRSQVTTCSAKAERLVYIVLP